MTTLRVIGLNHRTAPMKVREQMAFSAEGIATALLMFHKRFAQCELVIVSTCNRLELIIASEPDEPTDEQVHGFLAEARDLPVQEFSRCLYRYTGEQAIRHVFRVACGLDSMVVGEYQIVNQLKQAYAAASEQGTTGRMLNKLMHHAFAASGRVRSETEIGKRKVSIPSVAVDIARSIFADFARMQVLVIGAGEMSQLVCKHLQALNVKHFTVTSRTNANARALADACAGRAVRYDELDEQLARADIVITAVRCPRPILTAARVQAAQQSRRGRPLYLIDLALPRNIEPEVAGLRQVFVQDIDHLGRIVAENEQARMEHIDACEKILDEEIEQFNGWIAQSRTAPMIAQMYEDAHAVRDAELAWLQRTCPDLDDEQRAAVAQLAERLIGKMMHPYAATLKEHAMSQPTQTLAQTLHSLAHKCSAAGAPAKAGGNGNGHNGNGHDGNGKEHSQTSRRFANL
jgi:glutamyl-tRNA reductase